MFRRTAIIAALAAPALGLTTLPAAAEEKSVAVTQIVEHPALDAARLGIEEVLSENGFVPGANLKWSYQTAQGNMGTAAQIARKFVGEAPDVIVAISTPSAQTVAAAARNIPVVFTAVTDPVGAKLVKRLDKPGGLITGVSDMSPIGAHLAMIRDIMPNAETIGVPYNPGEANSVSLVEALKQRAPQDHFTIVEAPAPKSSDVLAAARSLVGRADVIYVPTDNTVVSALESVIKVGEDSKIPVFAGDTDSVPRGAIAAMGFNYLDVGRQTGEIVLRVLKGEKPGDIPVETIQRTQLWVNPKAATRMGITLEPGLIEAAAKVIE